MAWISRAGTLTQSEMENNANIVIATLRGRGLNEYTIAAILGNMQAESSINPERQEVGGQGYGLVQWTPVGTLQQHASNLGLSPYTSGDVQLEVMLSEIAGNPASNNEWYTSSAFISNYYNSGATSDMVGTTPTQFFQNTMGWGADKLAVMFMVGYERPSYNPDVNHYALRKQYALEWLTYMGGGTGTYTPRLDDTGIVGDFHYYSGNPFYQSGYGMPNCTCYAWGRFWEIGDPGDTGANRPTLPTGNAGTWFADVVASGDYLTGQMPALGAVICFSDNYGGAGHVAIVEQINPDGTITCSNSAWQGTFFFLTYITPVNGRYDWSHYTFQGFIYNPYAIQPTPPPPTSRKKKGFPWVLYAKKLRKRNKLY